MFYVLLKVFECYRLLCSCSMSYSENVIRKPLDISCFRKRNNSDLDATFAFIWIKLDYTRRMKDGIYFYMRSALNKW